MSVSVSRTPDRYRDKKIAGAKRRLRLWTAFMVLFLGWGTYTYITQMSTMEDLRQDLKVREKEKQAAEQIRNELKQEVDRLNTTEYILQIARSRGMVLPDEVIIRKHDE
ncbi:FtsB family cell division protein [Paenibacillus apiarius]|uniref:Septum formation initiator family protein n=1 Tax=Paenibacillus apiarius TaxID=46240 RepID=A0ABT4DZN2_9BACL|nr:septum formation initiator family protein [Paenibacillus apiarius]MBN3524353.1 septum formation initiator family protein [Paenibacillus apiarius]MCY9517389.1 septum formation initiator family protein [Paenibacillus apiarius]MCY9522809.1 septum formation initiator family protein [Paenibacillus apiarius]MCY9553050.1 septum formation initiator family protein [Paenibacillus apiarius]MCY9558785.1 septum formation initiator family protein [Paenibacillus apiarius]